MGRYDDAPISQAHREALDARVELRRKDPDLAESVLAQSVSHMILGKGCGSMLSESDHLWQVAREAYDRGDTESGDSFAQMGNSALDRYHDCLLHETISLPDEFLLE